MENQINQSPVINTSNTNQNTKILLIILTVLLSFILIGTFYLLIELNNIKKNVIKDNSNLETTETSITTDTTTPIEKVTISPTDTNKPLSDAEQIKSLICKRIGGCNESITFSIKKISGIFATGTSGKVEGSGTNWWTVKIDGTWKIVWETQDAMACQISQKYNIPVEMYALDGKTDDCYSEYSKSEINKFINGLKL